jgi:hypothetical protein
MRAPSSARGFQMTWLRDDSRRVPRAHKLTGEMVVSIVRHAAARRGDDLS